MICYVQKSGVQLLVIVSDKVIVGVGCHIRSRHFNIPVAGNVDTCGIIIFVILSCCNRESGDCTFSMIHNCVNIRWKYRICIVIDRNSRICPPEECLWRIGTVVKLSFDLDVRFIRIECEGRHSLCSVHFVDFTYIYGRRSIFVFFKIEVNRSVSGWTVVLRPVEFDTAGDPRTGKSYECRFDHMVVIDKIIVIRFVKGSLDTSTQFREDHHKKIVIFHVDCMILYILFLIRYFFSYRHRINLSCAALISAVF